MHEDHWGTSGIGGIFGLLCIHVAMGTRRRLNILMEWHHSNLGMDISVCVLKSKSICSSTLPYLVYIYTTSHNTTPGIVAVDLSGKLVAL